jgi:hypothetical protein
VEKMLGFGATQRRDLIYVCNECRLNCKAVGSDELALRLIDDVPQIFCPFDDATPHFKLAEKTDLAARGA